MALKDLLLSQATKEFPPLAGVDQKLRKVGALAIDDPYALASGVRMVRAQAS